MKKIFTLILITFFLSHTILAATPVEELAKVGVKVIESAKIQTNQDSWIQPEDQGTVTDEIDYWINRLPSNLDKKSNTYIIIPKLGVVAPVKSVAKNHPDFEKIQYGKTFDINNYLQAGIFRYPMTALPGHEGNSVYFGHSSYWKNDPGRYKTIFTTIPLLVLGDTIWVYTRGNEGGAFTKYVYEVTQSYETSASDVGVMMPTQGSTLTLVGCTDIGRADGRWIVKASLKDELTTQVLSQIVGDTKDGESTGTGSTQQGTGNTDTIVTQPIPTLANLSSEDKTRLNQYILRIKKLSPGGQKRVINRFEKYFIHVRNRMPAARGHADYLDNMLHQ